MTAPATQRTPDTLELYVRSLSPSAFRSRQEALINRLERLEAVGTITDYTVEVWGDQLAEPDIERTETGRRISEVIETFREWAETNGTSLAPFIETETVRSTITDETYTRIVFPAMTLAEYGPDELQFVTPCTDETTVHTPADRLDALEEASPLQTGTDREDPPADEPR